MGIKICLMVEHGDEKVERGERSTPPANTVYMIQLPSEYDEKQQIDCDGFFMDSISPVITIEDDHVLLKHCAMIRLGSRIYFFGGISNFHDYSVLAHAHQLPHPLISNELKLSVTFLQLDHPELGLCHAASLNAPKEIPCVFSARGMIYALGSSLEVCNSVFNLDHHGGNVCSGIFERYDPIDDKWQLLPDPPLPFGEFTKYGITYCDSATLIANRYIFIGNTVPKVFLVFDLDTQNWSSMLPSPLTIHFPYGSLCVDNSLYYVIGNGSHKFGTSWETNLNCLDQKEAVDEDYDDFNLQIVKRGPLLVDHHDPSKLFNDPCLRPQYKQVMTRLDQVAFLLDNDISEWRDIFHLGGRFYCYVVTSQLKCVYDRTRSQPNCRGVWIDVLEEVELPASKSTQFRTLASFSYRIRTPFKNNGFYIRCCAVGSVPDSWVKEPLKKKQVAKERKTFKAEQIQHDHGGGSKGQGDCNVEKIVAAGDDEIIRLRAELAMKEAELANMVVELAEKDLLLRTYESLSTAT